jgi:hypothetical protein
MERPDDDLRKELEELSPHLLKLKEQGEAFRLPDYYFQTLQAQVFEKIQTEESAAGTRKVLPGSNWLNQIMEQLQVLMQPRWALSLATMALLIAIGIGWMYQQNQATNQNLNTELAKLDPQTLDAYIQDNLYEFDTETLMEFASKKDSQLNFDEMNPEELDQYLDENLQELDEETIKELL